MIFSYPSGISYQRYESWGDEPWRHSEQEWDQRFRRDIGRPASRWRQYVRRLQERKEAHRALRAAINEELGLPADASLEDWGRALLTYQGDKLDELLGISEKISKLNESAA
jgi:hypothetical protein